ncbi:hypothetical protein TcWFU_008406 [Taenia crassiceps]|uniref:Uncharacterized protein n=1 Tax=Taenia crassiceps TaxID=6207 RepID=A0ABR4QSN1_9CEST
MARLSDDWWNSNGRHLGSNTIQLGSLCSTAEGSDVLRKRKRIATVRRSWGTVDRSPSRIGRRWFIAEFNAHA